MQCRATVLPIRRVKAWADHSLESQGPDLQTFHGDLANGPRAAFARPAKTCNLNASSLVETA